MPDNVEALESIINQYIHDAAAQEQALALVQQIHTDPNHLLVQYSHDIRSPFSSILGFLEILLGESVLPQSEEQRMNDLDEIKRSTLKLLGTLDDLIDYAKASTHNMSLVPTLLDVPAIVEKVKTLPQFTTHIVVAYNGDMQPVHHDAFRLRQIIIACLSHAQHISAPHHGISLKGATHDHLMLAIQCACDSPDLFDRHYQDPISPHGLAVPHQLCQLMGGEFHAELIDNTVTMTIALPLAYPAP